MSASPTEPVLLAIVACANGPCCSCVWPLATGLAARTAAARLAAFECCPDTVASETTEDVLHANSVTFLSCNHCSCCCWGCCCCSCWCCCFSELVRLGASGGRPALAGTARAAAGCLLLRLSGCMVFSLASGFSNTLMWPRSVHPGTSCFERTVVASLRHVYDASSSTWCWHSLTLPWRCVLHQNLINLSATVPPIMVGRSGSTTRMH
jgi:hypothetical protein